jgi:aspartyl protease family protein
LGSGVKPYIHPMSTEQIMQLTYLVLLGAAIGGSAIIAGRSNMGKMAQQAAIWALIFVGVIGAYGLWEDISQDVNPRQALLNNMTIAVPRSFDGHYHLTLDITGASQVVLTQQDAARVGLDPATLAYSGSASTANGEVRIAPVVLDAVTLEGIKDRDVRAVVNAGDMNRSLLGMTYLNRYARIEITNGQLVLQR